MALGRLRAAWGGSCRDPSWGGLSLEGSSRLQQDTFLMWSATHLVAICCGDPGR